MITFKNIAGNKFLAVGTIQRKSALNGEKSLTGTLYDGKDVLNKIDKGWSLEFDGEPYVVTYFERNDNDNSVSFDAIHKFFWDMTKKVLYSSTEISGSHTIKWYLDQIFANTGYTYALNFSPAAIEKDNWGNKTRLSLFNDLITSIAGEFEINGTLISIFQNIGTDLSTIVRYGFNLSDMTIENDATSFVTYGEGFGAYADQQNQTGDRVHATYTSPLASVYGILQAEPIDDQRYTSQSNLQAAVKAQVDASFSVSVQLSLYDLTAAGYPYKMANVGDWLTAVDENLDFKQRIRIISIDDEFSADGTRISYTVTAGDVGLTKKYQDANASMASQVANAVASASQAATDANNALISANGKNTSYYLNSVDDLPTMANEGDLAWVKSGDGTVMYIYTKKADGSYYWEKRIDPEMGDQITAGVTEAVAQANAHTDEVKRGLSTDIATAKSQAASQASTAEANAKSAAASQFNQAQNALSAAKTDLTNSIASEASARNQAVAAANSQAQSYANQAKADAMSAASSADGVIRTAISSSADSLSATITQNKSSADSGISTAQTTAQQAVDGLKTKVSQTDYNAKTGQLQTDLTTTTQTANQAKTDIVSIKQTDTSQNARMTQIESDASGVKTTVSDLQTTQGKQSGDISTLQQRADGFDATVTRVNNLSVGGRNYVLNSDVSTASNITNFRTSIPVSSFSGKIITVSVQVDYDNITELPASSNFHRIMFEPTAKDGKTGNFRYFGASITPKIGDSFHGRISATFDLTNVNIISQFTGDASVNIWGQGIYVQGVVGTNVSVSRPKIEIGNKATDWTPAPEDLSGATAKAQLTADQATLSINNYKTDADGRIRKAQADIVTNANAITQKVSQTDYNAKTGDLDTRVTKAQTTADGAVTTVGNYQTSNDARVKATETAIAQNANDITLRATTADLNSAKSDLNTAISQVKITADSISNFVRDSSGNISSDFQTALGKSSVIVDGNNKMISLINQKSDEIVAQISSVNLFPNSEFESDYGYESLSGDVKLSLAYKWVVGANQSGVVEIRSTANSYQGYRAEKIAVFGGSTISFSTLLHYENGGLASGQAGVDMRFYDRDGNETGKQFKYLPQQSDYWTTLLMENIYVPDTSVSLSITLIVNDAGAGQYAVFAQPMLVNSSTIKKYSPNADITTTLMLLKDKWAIGLADNIGNITSGIIGDSSSMSLISKNIVLDGNTTVTGDFKVWQANIANGAIGTAQIGDAAITNAKIADLDVSKITGDVTNFIQSYWNGRYGSTTITSIGMSINSGSVSTTFGTSGMEMSGGVTKASYKFGTWKDWSDNLTTSSGLYMGIYNSSNSFVSITGPSGATALLLAGSTMDYGNNTNIMRETLNIFSVTNVRERLVFKGNKWGYPSFIDINEDSRTFNFYTGSGSQSGGNYFWFNQKVLSSGTFSSTSTLSKKNVLAEYTEDALQEILKTDLVTFEYKNRPGEKQISPIIDDVNKNKKYYIPSTILGEEDKYVDMYSMITMAWKAIKQLSEKIGDK